MTTVLDHIRALHAEGRKGYAVLLDPDKVQPSQVPALAAQLSAASPSLILVGGSLLFSGDTTALVRSLKAALSIPVLLFPGHPMQLCPDADAVLLLSLISGRNPELLIGQHVLAAPFLKASKLEVIPTGYMLIDTGRASTVHYISGTIPIPHHKPDIAAATALAGEQLGLRLIYLEGGSGAAQTVAPEMVRAVREAVSLPLVVGGGIRSAAQAQALLDAGADLVVVGNALEDPARATLLHDLAHLTRHA